MSFNLSVENKEQQLKYRVIHLVKYRGFAVCEEESRDVWRIYYDSDLKKDVIKKMQVGYEESYAITRKLDDEIDESLWVIIERQL